MGFSDWDVYKSNANVSVHVDPRNPILDDGSLQIDFSTDGLGQAVVIPSDGSGNSHGFTRGKLRTLFRLDDGGALTIADEWIFGITCLQSQDDVTTSGEVYVGGLIVGAGHSYVLAKYSSGLSGPLTLLSTGGTAEAGEGFFRALELEWASSPTATQLTLRLGLLDDFSDLAVETSFIDTTSPFFASTAEGLFANNFEGTPDKACSFDKTRVYSIT